MLDGTLHLGVGHLKARDLGLDLLDLDAALDSGHLQSSFATGAERLGAEIDLRPDRAGWRFDIRAKGNLDLAHLLEAKDANALSHIQTALDTRLAGVATALSDLLWKADGHLELSLGAGRLHKKAADLLPLGGLLFTRLDVLNPLALDLDSRVHYNELQCAVLQFDLAQGIATIEYQIIAANLDYVVIVQSCHFDFNLKRLERYLVMVTVSTARGCGSSASLVLKLASGAIIRTSMRSRHAAGIAIAATQASQAAPCSRS